MGEFLMRYNDKNLELYIRNYFTTAEKIYENYINIRREVNLMERLKYDVEEKYLNNEDYKQGFLAGIKVMTSIYMDL